MFIVYSCAFQTGNKHTNSLLEVTSLVKTSYDEFEFCVASVKNNIELKLPETAFE